MTDHTRAMLEEAWANFMARPEPGNSGRYTWLSLHERFTSLLDAEAYLDAAMMLAPEGWEWCIDNWDGPSPTRCCAWGQFPNKGPGDNHYAETPALALLAAIMKAKNNPEAAAIIPAKAQIATSTVEGPVSGKTLTRHTPKGHPDE